MEKIKKNQKTEISDLPVTRAKPRPKFLSIVGGVAVGSGVVLYRSRRRLIAGRLGLPAVLHEVRVERDIAIPADDGIKLMTDHYAPISKGLSQNQKSPTILIRTPYGRGFEIPFPGAWMWIFVAQRFAERGYHVVIQTTRGRFDSGGEFQPRQNERRDGLATLEWLKRQIWFNGQVATWGPSYLGFVQWAIADSALIKAMMPIVTSSRAYEITYPDGVFDLDRALKWVYNLTLSGGSKREPFWKTRSKFSKEQRQKNLAPALMHLPIKEADQVGIGQPIPFYREWLEHSQPDSGYWNHQDDSKRVAEVTAPVHLVSGWYDFMLRELLTDYQTLAAAGHKPYLTLGPWFHVSPECFLEALRVGIAWFDAQLKGDSSRLRSKPVRYFVMGADEWREADTWPPASVSTSYFLHEKSQLSLIATPADTPSLPDRYRYDPANPTPALGGTLLTELAGPKDNRELETRSDVLVYSTAPLEREVEINGWVKLELFVKSSLEHTDFFGRLCDVQPDGRSINICDGLVRVKPGQGEKQPDGSLKVVLDLWATAQRFKRGHAIRLQVSSGAHPHWTRNLGTGEPFATATTMQEAEQTIYHDAEHPSALLLPVVS
jgi:putative CocE/NonD family hydrolase